MNRMIVDHQLTWSPMTTETTSYKQDRVINDLEAICFHMGIPTSNQFDNHLSAGHLSRRRATLPSSGTPKTSAQIACLQAMNKCQLDNIPEILSTSPSSDEQNRSSDSDNSHSNSNAKRTHTFIVTPTINITEPTWSQFYNTAIRNEVFSTFISTKSIFLLL